MRRWAVVSGLLEHEGNLLLVANRRRNGSVDWSPPGGVIDPGEHELGALGREVLEETGLVVDDWHGPVYEIAVEFPELEWDLRVVVYRALGWSGELVFDDPDGIVHDARFVDATVAAEHLASAPRWVADPVADWLADPWTEPRHYAYTVRGQWPGAIRVERR